MRSAFGIAALCLLAALTPLVVADDWIHAAQDVAGTNGYVFLGADGKEVAKGAAWNEKAPIPNGAVTVAVSIPLTQAAVDAAAAFAKLNPKLKVLIVDTTLEAMPDDDKDDLTAQAAESADEAIEDAITKGEEAAPLDLDKVPDNLIIDTTQVIKQDAGAPQIPADLEKTIEDAETEYMQEKQKGSLLQLQSTARTRSSVRARAKQPHWRRNRTNPNGFQFFESNRARFRLYHFTRDPNSARGDHVTFEGAIRMYYFGNANRGNRYNLAALNGTSRDRRRLRRAWRSYQRARRRNRILNR